MILKQNEEGKYVLLDQEGNKAVFDYGVDASEALTLKDKDGNHRFTLPEVKSAKPLKKPTLEPVDETDEEVKEPVEAVTEVVKREVKTLGKKSKAAKAKAAKAKKEKAAKEK